MPNPIALQTSPVFFRQLDRVKTPFAFSARTPRDARRWRRSARPALYQHLVGDILWRRCPLKPKRIQSVDRGDHVREKWMLTTAPGVVMPVYVLRQKGLRGKQPVVIAFHGHGYGAKDTVGLWEDGSERLEPEGYQKDFAVALCRRGFVVAVPEIACFGERTTDFSYLAKPLEHGQPFATPVPTTCQHAGMIAWHLGGSVLGLRVHEGRRLVDWLITREDVDRKRIGAMGISGGGMHTLYSACVDERISASVISGFISDLREGLLNMYHCPCSYVHGMAKFGGLEDLTGLIAPRPLLIQAANHDHLFPITGAKRTIAASRRIYATSGAPEFPAAEYFSGRHEIGGEPAYAFLRKHLGAAP